MATTGQAAGGRGDARLTERGIYTAALRLIDADGVGALSMRKLAGVLGVNPMSLYHHVPNKAALLRGVKNLVAAQFQPRVDGGTWQEQLGRFARDFRALAHRHPNLIVHSLGSPDFIEPEDPFWTGLTDILDSAGVPAAEVAPVGAVLTSLFSGFLLAEGNGALGRLAAMQPAPAKAASTAAAGVGADSDSSFEFAVQTLVAGLEARLS
ncbi:TetR family transcriptional regulator [Micromonospora sp. PPF5-17]|uniref:TetR/AcrR family transcriptional regulator n=1 Tax=Micromonospora solifontis TaxID=2487138 RepID=A0ABX9W8W9_9ACTN|nr:MULTISPECIES: TetR/AcrR family transcriptional regulator [Micromonospora]NES39514.1 TetR family transcriptional regulator [Micromonospora solifontis]NES59044.1 TetR family transcriptional regulator [Micromonospora sp. PPF5-6]RNL88368.1 TetR/AcrR family transcriptional regulator [Micromonospora solifontis]